MDRGRLASWMMTGGCVAVLAGYVWPKASLLEPGPLALLAGGGLLFLGGLALALRGGA
ncbi:MAG TPA: hypothetical protein VHH36_02015 [Candidatus Thermoplasmatota archaeon]|nr:hypothetical protein [Candidatus Thermoplasmatota archaeon]